VTAEESETPGGESGAGTGGSQTGGLGAGGGPARGPEGDLLAERRARRAAESGETALIRRAETAEATVRTLETHVASLQQRLGEAEEEQRRISEMLEAETPAAGDRSSSIEQELRLAKQREYAEQQLRIAAEDRCIDLERESHLEVERLSRRLGASERIARELTDQLESVHRELAEAEQAAAATKAGVRRSERALQARLSELERRALEIQRGLEAERAARERSERLLESMRLGHRRVEGLVAELRGGVARLRAAAATAPPQERPGSVGYYRRDAAQAAGGAPAQADRDEMTAALAAAVERLRARVEDAGDVAREDQQTGTEASTPAPVEFAAPAPRRSAHRHSYSLLGRLRLRRKDRRERRAAADQPPSMKSK